MLTFNSGGTQGAVAGKDQGGYRCRVGYFAIEGKLLYTFSLPSAGSCENSKVYVVLFLVFVLIMWLRYLSGILGGVMKACRNARWF